ncbi:MAG TPA: hypothetical protein VIM08_12250 [Arthrobacter sp.]|jgi:alpha-galactosidase
MRADFAVMEMFDLKSTSDQEDFVLYPAIAAGAPVQILPEQAGNWACPQPSISNDEIAYTMVSGLSGRLYLSGFLDQMDARQSALVQNALTLSKSIRDDIALSVPGWPMGLPDWYAASVALTLKAPDRTFVYVWHRGSEDAELTLHLGTEVRARHLIEQHPRTLTAWSASDGPANTIILRPGLAGMAARVYEIIQD